MSLIQTQFPAVVHFARVYSYSEMAIRSAVSSNSIESNIFVTQIMSVLLISTKYFCSCHEFRLLSNPF